MAVPPGGKSWAILIADDDDATRVLLMKDLQSKGYTVRAVADGPAAMDELAASHVDLTAQDLMIAVTPKNIVTALGADENVTTSKSLPVLLARAELRSRRTVNVEQTIASDAPGVLHQEEIGGLRHLALNSPGPTPTAAAKKEGTTLSEQLGIIIRKRIAADRLDLPAPSEAANNCLELMQTKPDVLGKELVRVLRRDPVLTAQLVRVANAPRYGAGIRTLEQAVTRLGHRELKSVILAASTRKLFSSKDPRIAGMVQVMYGHAVAVASLGRGVATLFDSAEVDTIYLAGLLHDVGKIVVAGYLLEAERALVGQRGAWLDENAWLDIVSDCHRPIGVAIAVKWAFPDEVVQAVRTCSEYDTTETTAPANFVCLANSLAKSHGVYERITDPLDDAAAIMLGCSVLRLNREIVEQLTLDVLARVARGEE
jgi:putative nucleotidyltransferase with HDIG domain